MSFNVASGVENKEFAIFFTANGIIMGKFILNWNINKIIKLSV
jgi:hypothetical protein